MLITDWAAIPIEQLESFMAFYLCLIMGFIALMLILRTLLDRFASKQLADSFEEIRIGATLASAILILLLALFFLLSKSVTLGAKCDYWSSLGNQCEKAKGFLLCRTRNATMNSFIAQYGEFILYFNQSLVLPSNNRTLQGHP